MDTQLINQLKDDKGVALVEFFATWCPHCQRMMPVVDDVRALVAGKANVYQFDIDKNREFADALEVDGIPTFIVYKGGEEAWRCEGEVDGSVLVSHVLEA